MAGFNGISMRQAYWFQTQGNEAGGSYAPSIYTVGALVESSVNGLFTSDLSAYAIDIHFLTRSQFSGGTYSGPVYTDWSSTLAPIIGVTLVTNMPGLDASDLYWNANTIAINWVGLFLDPAYYVHLDVSFYEPATVAWSFTDLGDGVLSAPVDFNLVGDGVHTFSGNRYYSAAGNDYVILPDFAAVSAANPWDYSKPFKADGGDDVVQGGDGSDKVLGAKGNDWLWGGAGNDDLSGGEGNDFLSGGAGTDLLNGSSGADVFVFTDAEIGTTKATGNHDIVGDYHGGLDKLDLSALFSDHAASGVRFSALDGSALSAYAVGIYSMPGKTLVEGDITGDGRADFVIELSGSNHVDRGDLILTPADWTAAVGLQMFDYATAHSDQLLPV